MLGVGWTEMLLIGIVALVVIGPKELPAVMHRIGKFAATIRRMGQDFQRELNKTTGLNEITNLRNSVTAPLKATADAIRKEFNTTTTAGTVEPSGALKPADPKVESVVSEIQKAAGMTPAADATATAAAPAAAPPFIPASTEPPVPATPAPSVSTEAPAKPRRTPKIKVPTPDKPVASADLPAAASTPSVDPMAEAAQTEAKVVRKRKTAAAADVAVPAEAVSKPTRSRTKAAGAAIAEGGAVADETTPKPTRARKPAAPKKG